MSNLPYFYQVEIEIQITYQVYHSFDAFSNVFRFWILSNYSTCQNLRIHIRNLSSTFCNYHLLSSIQTCHQSPYFYHLQIELKFRPFLDLCSFHPVSFILISYLLTLTSIYHLTNSNLVVCELELYFSLSMIAEHFTVISKVIIWALLTWHLKFSSFQ